MAYSFEIDGFSGKYYNVEGAAEVMNKSVSQILYMVKYSQICHVEINGRYFITEKAALGRRGS